ncbi:MAG: hypothetical protein HOP12_04145 [Candidatus Eisenbacteria bacterium]|uniref:Tetratricopeptide repeat protein n=1 Tax=Eiseniibacteriota bacterium TaxID=2212470 RepID=A0A849SL85_UNCEI|nr:hypothetical protein [Candidatus Eisenbacteria bacterium]
MVRNPRGRPDRLLLMAMLALVTSSCSIQRMATRGVADALTRGPDVYSTDDDPELVREAIPFGLKTLESLLASLPDHEGLLLASCSGFTQYAVGFVAMDALAVPAEEFARAQALRERALGLCLRGRDYGLHGLERRHRGIGAQLQSAPVAAAAQIGREELPMLYWTAAAWGSAISLGKDRPELLADVATIRALMERGLALDERYEDGAFHEAMIVLDALPEAMGGSRERAQRHYDRALELTQGRRASLFVTWAENVTVPAQDPAEFSRQLERALAIDPAAFPKLRLMTLLMQRKARALEARRSELFLELDEATEPSSNAPRHLDLQERP